MTQDAVVTKNLANGMAEIVVERGTACGGSCENCESCVFQNQIKAVAKNNVYALPGQKVIIESKSSKVFKAIFLVYVLPFILFFIGYAISYACNLSEGLSIVISFFAFALGFLFVYLIQKSNKKTEITYEIIRIC